MNAESVRDVARMSHLTLPDDAAELDALRRDLSAVLGSLRVVQQLAFATSEDAAGRLSKESPTSAVSPACISVRDRAPLRADVEEQTPGTDIIVSGAPVREGDYFQVPRVVE